MNVFTLLLKVQQTVTKPSIPSHKYGVGNPSSSLVHPPPTFFPDFLLFSFNQLATHKNKRWLADYRLQRLAIGIISPNFKVSHLPILPKLK